MDYVRSTNTITDIFPGLTLNVLGKSPLLADGSAQSTATVSIGRDTTALTTNINNLVTAYNDAVSMMNVVTDPKSTVDTYGATLVGDTTIQSIKRQLRSLFSAPSTATGAATSSVSALWQMGFSFDQKGVLSVDSTKLNTALTNNFSDVVRAFTNNSENSLLTTNTGNGIAGDAVKTLTDMLGNSGVIKQHSDNATTQNTKYQTNLTNLQTRMDALLVRYQKQFSSMDSIVGKITGQKTSLKSSFDGLMSMYTNK
jgi:flagellar hook-associated protein 2